jgi:hypothetical protein
MKQFKAQFKAQLTARGPGGAFAGAVAGTLNGFAFQNSLMPNGDGTHSMMVSKALQAGAKAAAGDRVSVALDVDRSERVVTVPPELKSALSNNKKAAVAFKALSYSHLGDAPS